MTIPFLSRTNSSASLTLGALAPVPPAFAAFLGRMTFSLGMIPRSLLGGSIALAIMAALTPALQAAEAAQTNTVSALATNLPPGTNTAAGTNVASAVNMETLDDTYKLAVGDRLSLRIVEDQEEPRPLIVMQSGGIEVPYIGRFPALNKTCKLLAKELKAQLEKEYYYQATVIVAVDELSRSRGRVYLFGSVRMPGPQDIPSDEVYTLSKAIMRAGGFGEFADKKHVKVTRKGPPGQDKPQILVRNVADVIEKGDTRYDLDLEVGDIIYIPARLLNF